MNKIFDNQTTAQIDAKLHYDILQQENKLFKIIIIIIIGTIFLFRGWIGYWLKFGIAFPSKININKIDVDQEPLQENYSQEIQKSKTFTYKSLTTGKKVKIIPQASYKLSGLIVNHEYNYLFKYDPLNNIALYDLGLSWGKLGNKQLYKNYYKNYTYSNYRVLWSLPKYYEVPLSKEYSKSHYSHSYIIPANRNIMAALLKLKNWQKVELEGELVDIEKTSGETIKTSLTRTDEGWQGDRGSGSSEIIFLQKIKIKNHIYQ